MRKYLLMMAVATALVVLWLGGVTGTVRKAQAREEPGVTALKCHTDSWDKSIKQTRRQQPTRNKVVGFDQEVGNCYKVTYYFSSLKRVHYRIGYVRTLKQVGSGKRIDTFGNRVLRVNILAGVSQKWPYKTGRLMTDTNVNHPGFPVIAHWYAGSFEGVTSIGIDMSRAKPFKVRQKIVQEKNGPTRELLVKIKRK